MIKFFLGNPWQPLQLLMCKQKIMQILPYDLSIQAKQSCPFFSIFFTTSTTQITILVSHNSIYRTFVLNLLLKKLYQVYIYKPCVHYFFLYQQFRILEGVSFKNQNINYDGKSVSLISDRKNQSFAEVWMTEVEAFEELLLLMSRIVNFFSNHDDLSGSQTDPFNKWEKW